MIDMPDFFLDRLRAEPIAETVPGSLPVLFFGNFFAASIATVGLNPSLQEYLSPGGEELDGPGRRFETLRSLGVPSRSSLSDEHAVQAMARMRGYFECGKPVYRWFGGLSRVVQGMGFSFTEGCAVHLDLLQEATDPTWSRLRPTARTMVLGRDLQFLRRQIEEFPLRAVVCTSRRVLDEVNQMLSATVVAQGKLERVRWTVGIAGTPRGSVGIVGWNIPLARPTGLTGDGQVHLGQLLATQLERAGVALRG